jgi:cyclic pyranopterin monophosphate synthase
MRNAAQGVGMPTRAVRGSPDPAQGATEGLLDDHQRCIGETCGRRFRRGRRPAPSASMSSSADAINEMTDQSPHAMGRLTHFDPQGASRMVDVGEKPVTERSARASGRVRMQPATLALIRDRKLAKGDVLEVARLAGIMGAKRTSELIPLCHPLPMESVEISFGFAEESIIAIEATVRVTAKTGVEMEALTAVSVAALTIYDMCKAVDRAIEITDIRLEEKSGGRSGHYVRPT